MTNSSRWKTKNVREMFTKECFKYGWPVIIWGLTPAATVLFSKRITIGYIKVNAQPSTQFEHFGFQIILSTAVSNFRSVSGCIQFCLESITTLTYHDGAVLASFWTKSCRQSHCLYKLFDSPGDTRFPNFQLADTQSLRSLVGSDSKLNPPI